MKVKLQIPAPVIDLPGAQGAGQDASKCLPRFQFRPAPQGLGVVVAGEPIAPIPPSNQG